jgi:hypothetical protein
MDVRRLQRSDIVLVSKHGRLFYALVRGSGVGGRLVVEPIERGVRDRHATAGEIVDCWQHATTDERGPGVPAGQCSFDHLLDP